MSDELNILRTEPCRELRSKGMYINAGLPDGQEVTGDGHFWCLRTMESYGPDGQAIGRKECRAGRDCYRTVI
jgi:hypothetical protein